MPYRRPPERVSFYRRLPLWFQWGLPFSIVIAAVVALVLFADAQKTKNTYEDSISAKQLKAEDRISSATMEEEQQPHTAKLKAGLTPAHALESAIKTWIDGQYEKNGSWGGEVSRATCTPASGSTQTADRIALKCTLVIARVSYPFRGVVQPKRGHAIYCEKIAYPAEYGQKTVPLPSACT